MFFVISFNSQAQAVDKDINQNIEDLSIYPNPVSNGKLYIVTKSNLTKEIEIFNVLGKSIFQTTLFGKELNISKLNAGIYIIKIKENNISTTRKLIIR
ncbi:T9SS type A sorting domain-containing protein [Formosa haliotis]|uniref:T9SS type A sorting domain-containing protein n=1 Tax=Formosa haliotis TaxID=1555194 RepID=UPI00350E49F7